MTRPANAFRFPIDHIRLGEFDLGTVLYHAHYFHLYEEAREEFFRQGQIPYTDFVKLSRHLPLVETHQKFVFPIFYGERLELFLWTTEVKRASFSFHYEIVSLQRGVTVHFGKTTHVLVQIVPGSTTPSVLPLPDDLRMLLKTIEN